MNPFNGVVLFPVRVLVGRDYDAAVRRVDDCGGSSAPNDH